MPASSLLKLDTFRTLSRILLARLAVSFTSFQLDIPLSHDLILVGLLPPLLFEGAATTDFSRLHDNLVPILAVATLGLLTSIALLGWIGTFAFGFPLIVALVFAAMMLPTDPVSVLALFEEAGAPEQLAVLVASELDEGDTTVSAVNVSQRLFDVVDELNATLELTPIGSTNIITRI